MKKLLLLGAILSALILPASAMTDGENQILNALLDIKAQQTSLSGGGGSSTVSLVGAAHAASSHVTASTSASTLAIARATRRSCLFRNLDASINVWIGPATVTSGTGGNGMILKPGESIPVTAITLWQVIAESGSPIIAVTDEYD